MPTYVAFILFVFVPSLLLMVLLASSSGVLGWLSAASDKFSQRLGEAVGMLLYKYYPSPAGDAISAGYRAAELGEAIDRPLRATLVEGSILFLHEVEFATNREFARVEGNVIYVTRRHLRKIEDFTLLSDEYGHSASATFAAHGYELTPVD